MSRFPESVCRFASRITPKRLNCRFICLLHQVPDEKPSRSYAKVTDYTNEVGAKAMVLLQAVGLKGPVMIFSDAP